MLSADAHDCCASSASAHRDALRAGHFAAGYLAAGTSPGGYRAAAYRSSDRDPGATYGGGNAGAHAGPTARGYGDARAH
jgi:hypothetical protein